MTSNNPFFNPYQALTFWEFLMQWVMRMGALLTGRLSLAELVTDEIQVLVLSGVALSSALVGTFLVLRRMTMLANSLSHTILMGIVLAYLMSQFYSGHRGEHHGAIAPMPAMLGGALMMGLITAFLTEFLTKTARLQEDASTGLVFTTLFALGVILVTMLTRDAHIGTEAVMGNADALHMHDLFWVTVILGLNSVIFLSFFKEMILTTFDNGLAAAMGFSPVFFNYLLMTQVSATSITAFRAVGVLLVLTFMTGPPLAARLLTHRLKSLLGLSALIGVGCSLCGVALTRHLLTVYDTPLSTAGVVTTLIFLVYGVIICIAPERGLCSQWWRRRWVNNQIT